MTRPVFPVARDFHRSEIDFRPPAGQSVGDRHFIMKQIASFFCLLLFAVSLACCGTASAQQSFAGKVAETMDAGGYTYVLVDAGTNKLWAAAPQFPVKQGDLVTVPGSEPMTDFHSKTLNRDFP